MANEKKYASLSALQTFLNNLKNLFATQTTVDELSANVAEKSKVQVVAEGTSEILSTLKIYKLTQEEYDDRVESNTLEDNALYLMPQEEIDLSEYATIEQLDNKAEANHNHNDIYYTESEIDNKISAINTSISNSLNESKSYSNANLNEAKLYTDSSVSQKTQVQIILWEDDD